MYHHGAIPYSLGTMGGRDKTPNEWTRTVFAPTGAAPRIVADPFHNPSLDHLRGQSRCATRAYHMRPLSHVAASSFLAFFSSFLLRDRNEAFIAWSSVPGRHRDGIHNNQPEARELPHHGRSTSGRWNIFNDLELTTIGLECSPTIGPNSHASSFCLTLPTARTP
jgi:hypothetical protein